MEEYGGWLIRAQQAQRRRLFRAVCLIALVASFGISGPAAAWEPTRPVELIVPAGKGGGADQMARLLQQIITTHGLVRQPVVVINKSGGDGAEGFLHMKASANNPHKLLVALSSLFTTPRASGIGFSYRDLSQVGMLALDPFVLWVHADAPYATARDYFDAIRAAPDHTFSVGGTGVKQEDQLLTFALEKQLGKKLSYASFRGGGDVATRLAGKQVTCSLNNPLEALEHWRAGRIRPLCVLRAAPLAQSKPVSGGKAWSDVPACKVSGVDVDYQMLRGVFLPNGASPEQVTFYVELLRGVLERQEWHDHIAQGGLDARFLTGPAFDAWLERTDTLHAGWMREAGLLHEPGPPN
jgi:putative tricarboxylic transport membrane protein